ncbi:class I SAM-dependent methyltransferase [Sphingomonas sp. dw_22]|uniref:class I SAM-dependent methyltransferase n=1 Tax=Sphingomonas sp. dw_22 TaxID=2721175 RepID=UPI001BD3DE28|nr:class I SAM-dependent methyltransferase [Sphingomonas sp. dw_22]
MSTQDGIAEHAEADQRPGKRRPTISDVARAYRLFLGRELESASMAGFHIGNSPDLWDLVETVSTCAEASRQRVAEAAAAMRTFQGQLSLELDASPAQLEALRHATMDAWKAKGLGRYDEWLRQGVDHFAKRSGRWNLEKTLERGKIEATDLLGTLSRLGWAGPVDATITVVGAQAFRMREAAPHLVGVELVESDLALAERAQAPGSGTSPRALSITDYDGDPPETDIFYSVSALQYAPPPLLLDMLRCFLARVRPGGVAAFQVPCYLHDYQFGIDAYLSGEGRDTAGELHCVPQSRILALLSQEGFQLLEVSPDERVGKFGLSYFFVAEKTVSAAALRSPEHAATITGNEDMIVDQTMAKSELGQAVQAREWFHRIDLGDGLITPGGDDSPYKLTALGLPKDLSGKSVLDVGAWDGFFSFECERRGGAQVVASDSYCWNGQGVFDGGGFRLAHAALESRVVPLNASVEQLDPAVHGTFDYVLFLGVLYHARDPLGYLAKVRALCRGTAIIETVVDALDVDRPALIFYPGATLNRDGSNFFGPNEAAVIAMCKEVGFSRVEVANRFYYDNRMVFHAHV